MKVPKETKPKKAKAPTSEKVDVGNIRKQAKALASKIARKAAVKVERPKKAATFKKKAAKTLNIRAKPVVLNKSIEKPLETTFEGS